MTRILLILIILISSCNNPKNASNDVKPNNSAGTFSNSLLKPEHILQREVKQIEKNIIKILTTNNSDSVQQALEEIYYWDQVFRDSTQKGFNLVNQSKQKYFLIEKMNENIVLNFLKESGWPKTKNMTKKAQDAFCLVVIHSHDKELNIISSSLLDEAFYVDSSMNNELFAGTYDKIQLSFGRNYKFGTLRFKKEEHHDTTIIRINKNRRAIGLSDI